MNHPTTRPPDTAAALVEAAFALFADRGYDGTSIRAITERAGTNLGAVTYHFGSKEALYHRVIETALVPLRARVLEAADGRGPALDRIEAIVGAAFEHYAENPALPRLMLQQVASGRPAPPPARIWIRTVLELLSDLVAKGQAEGTIRDGDPRLLAVSAVGQTLFLHLIRGPLRDAVGLDVLDPATRARLKTNVLGFVRAALGVAEAA